jgi:hypothetical protein
MNLLQALSSPGDAPKCFGLPIVGGIPERRNTGARLACIINLKQSKTTAYRVIDKADAYLRFMKQIITPKDFLPQQQDVPVILKGTRNSPNASSAPFPAVRWNSPWTERNSGRRSINWIPN